MPSLSLDIINAVKQTDIHTFIETGTNHGNTIQTVLPFFRNIYSVELSANLYEKCKQRFGSYDHVHLANTTSKDFLNKLCPTLNKKAIIFLDAHYDGVGTNSALDDVWIPISDELDAIALSPVKNHVIIIDDMSCMDNSHFDKNTQKWAGAPGIHVVLDKLLIINPNYKFYIIAESDKLIASADALDLTLLRFDRNECPWGNIDPFRYGRNAMKRHEVLALLEPPRKKEVIKILKEVNKSELSVPQLEAKSLDELWKLKMFR